MGMEETKPADLNTSLLNQSVDANGEPGSAGKKAEAMKKKMGLALLSKLKKKTVIPVESIYNC
jgi:hypothetical protein